MSPDSLEARLVAEGLRPSSWGNGPGDRYAEHEHDYDKVLVATRGSITFHLAEPGHDVYLHEGERLDLPARTRHAASVGPNGVSCLEGHLPAGSLAGAPRHRPEWSPRPSARRRRSRSTVRRQPRAPAPTGRRSGARAPLQ